MAGGALDVADRMSATFLTKNSAKSDSTGYQMNYPARTGTRYLDTCCIIANFLVYFVVRINKMHYSLCLFSALCAHTLHRSTTNICKTVGLHDSLVL